jgi:hypothetical protein
MKRFSLLILCSLFAVMSYAQLTTQASGYEKSFWQYIEKLKALDPEGNAGAYQNTVLQAETSLKQLKKYAADYNTAKHDAALKPYQDAVAKAEADKVLQMDRDRLDASIAKAKAEKLDYMKKDLITKAERELANLKIRTPGYDASAYDKQLADLKASSPAANNSGGAAPAKGGSPAASTGGNADQTEFHDEFWPTFKSRSNGINWGEDCRYTDADAARMNQFCTDLRNKYAAFANSAIGQKGKNFSIDPAFGDVKTAIDESALVNDRIEDIRNSSGTSQRSTVVRKYYELMWNTDYYSALAKLFPQAKEVQEAAGRLKAVQSELGDLNAWLARMDANYTALVETRTLRPAGAHDPAIEAEFKSVFLATGWGKDIIQINLWAPSWKIEYHEITHDILYRWRLASIVTPGENGRCVVHEFALKQVYQGSGVYGRSVSWRSDDQRYEMLCSKME